MRGDVEEEELGRIHWRVFAPVNQDVFNVYAYRYVDISQTSGFPSTEVLRPEGYWVQIPDGGTAEPSLVIPGRLVYAVANGTKYPRIAAVESLLTELVEKIQAEMCPSL